MKLLSPVSIYFFIVATRILENYMWLVVVP
jgi:hypothetical protein